MKWNLFDYDYVKIFKNLSIRDWIKSLFLVSVCFISYYSFGFISMSRVSEAFLLIEKIYTHSHVYSIGSKRVFFSEIKEAGSSCCLLAEARARRVISHSSL